MKITSCEKMTLVIQHRYHVFFDDVPITLFFLRVLNVSVYQDHLGIAFLIKFLSHFCASCVYFLSCQRHAHFQIVFIIICPCSRHILAVPLASGS